MSPSLSLIWLIPVVLFVAWTVVVYRLGNVVGRDREQHDNRVAQVKVYRATQRIGGRRHG